MSSEKRKIAYIDGKPYEIGPNHTSILKFVKSLKIINKVIGFVNKELLRLEENYDVINILKFGLKNRGKSK